MPYDKPKVTIDLEEYNSLIDEKNRIAGDEYVSMAKTVLASFINNQMNVRVVGDDLAKLGIIFSVTNPGTSICLSPENIVIMKVKDAK